MRSKQFVLLHLTAALVTCWKVPTYIDVAHMPTSASSGQFVSYTQTNENGSYTTDERSMQYLLHTASINSKQYEIVKSIYISSMLGQV